MTWPDGPRFVVTSVRGWPIGPVGTAHRKPTTVWYVHDEAQCGQVVARFVRTGGDYSGSVAETRARAHAALLNQYPPTAVVE